MKNLTLLIMVVVSCSSLFASGRSYKLAVENKILKQHILKLTLALKKANHSPTKALIQAKAKISQLKKKNKQLKKAYDVVVCENQELAQTVQKLQTDVVSYDDTYKKARNQITSLQSQYNNVCNERDVFKQKYDSVCIDLSTIENKYASAYKDGRQWKSKYNQVCQDRDTFKTKYSEIHQQVNGLNSQYAAACSERDGFKKQYSDVCGKIQTLENKIAHLQQKNVSLEKICQSTNSSCTVETSRAVQLQFSKVFPSQKRKIVSVLKNTGWNIIQAQSDRLGNLVIAVETKEKIPSRKAFKMIKKSLKVNGIHAKLISSQDNKIAIALNAKRMF